MTGLCALTIHQPYAALIAEGIKTIETRAWHTPYRGPLVIHAGRDCSGVPEALEWMLRSPTTQPIRQALKDHGYGRLVDVPSMKFQALVAVVELVDCELMTETNIPPDGVVERLCGDYTPGRHMWHLANVVSIEPIPCRGQRKLWRIPRAEQEMIECQYRARTGSHPVTPGESIDREMHSVAFDTSSSQKTPRNSGQA